MCNTDSGRAESPHFEVRHSVCNTIGASAPDARLSQPIFFAQRCIESCRFLAIPFLAAVNAIRFSCGGSNGCSRLAPEIRLRRVERNDVIVRTCHVPGGNKPRWYHANEISSLQIEPIRNGLVALRRVEPHVDAVRIREAAMASREAVWRNRLPRTTPDRHAADSLMVVRGVREEEINELAV